MFLITLLAVVLILRKYLQQKELFLFGYLDCSVKKLIKISNVVIVDINGNHKYNFSKFKREPV